MRLNKYLSESGEWSRREADRLIEEGRAWDKANGIVREPEKPSSDAQPDIVSQDS